MPFCKKRLECNEFVVDHPWCEETGNYDCFKPYEATEQRPMVSELSDLLVCHKCGYSTTADNPAMRTYKDDDNSIKRICVDCCDEADQYRTY